MFDGLIAASPLEDECVPLYSEDLPTVHPAVAAARCRRRRCPAGGADESRITGTLEQHEESTIAVTKHTGKTVSIKIDRQTAISQTSSRHAPWLAPCKP
jgi:hypothetical protein